MTHISFEVINKSRNSQEINSKYNEEKMMTKKIGDFSQFRVIAFIVIDRMGRIGC